MHPKTALAFTTAAYFKTKPLASFLSNIEPFLANDDARKAFDTLTHNRIYELDSTKSIVYGPKWASTKETLLQDLPKLGGTLKNQIDSLTFYLFCQTIRPYDPLRPHHIEMKPQFTLKSLFDFGSDSLARPHNLPEPDRFAILSLALVQLLVSRILIPSFKDNHTLTFSNFACIGYKSPTVYRDCHRYKYWLYHLAKQEAGVSEDSLAKLVFSYLGTGNLLDDLNDFVSVGIMDRTKETGPDARGTVYKLAKRYNYKIEWGHWSYRKVPALAKIYESAFEATVSELVENKEMGLQVLYRFFQGTIDRAVRRKINDYHMFESIFSEILETGKAVVSGGNVVAVLD